MIEEKALVVSVDQNSVVVEASRQSACGQCASKGDCGQSSIAQWAASKMMNIKVENPANISVVAGDFVLVGISERSFIKASLLLYLYPLIIMFAVSLLATLAGLPEWQVVLSAFAGVLISFFCIKHYAKRMTGNLAYQLQLISVI